MYLEHFYSFKLNNIFIDFSRVTSSSSMTNMLSTTYQDLPREVFDHRILHRYEYTGCKMTAVLNFRSTLNIRYFHVAFVWIT